MMAEIFEQTIVIKSDDHKSSIAGARDKNALSTFSFRLQIAAINVR